MSCLRQFFWGYSLAFGEGSVFIGDLKHFGLINVLDAPSPGSDRLPELLFCLYQLVFATLTPILAFGATAERGRLGPLMVLVFCWHTIVYCPIAHWTWSPSGWLFQLGDLDYAGGGPVCALLSLPLCPAHSAYSLRSTCLRVSLPLPILFGSVADEVMAPNALLTVHQVSQMSCLVQLFYGSAGYVHKC